MQAVENINCINSSYHIWCGLTSAAGTGLREREREEMREGLNEIFA